MKKIPSDTISAGGSSVFFVEQLSDGRHGHLLSQQHDEAFKEQGKTTALSGPWSSRIWSRSASFTGSRSLAMSVEGILSDVSPLA
jgi:hypothetical protein